MTPGGNAEPDIVWPKDVTHRQLATSYTAKGELREDLARGSIIHNAEGSAICAQVEDHIESDKATCRGNA